MMGQQRLLSRQGKEVTWREDWTSLNYGAKGGSRTHTLLRTLGPEPNTPANSATLAVDGLHSFLFTDSPLMKNMLE